VGKVLEDLSDKGVFGLASSEGESRALAEGLLLDWSRKSPQEILDKFVMDIAAGMIPTIVNTLPELGHPGAIRVRQVIDWRIDAAVTKAPPYEVVVSTSLVLLVASMVNALLSGLGIDWVDDEGRLTAPAEEPRPVDVVARDIKRLLDGFMAEQQISVLDGEAAGKRYAVQFKLLLCALSWTVGHELGHIVSTECRRSKQAAPFQPFATKMLETYFQQLLNDKRFQDSMGPQSEEGQLLIFDNWLSEINADIMGASLTCGYQRDRGPDRDVPGIVGYTKFAIHLGLLSQYMLGAYMNLLDSSHKLASQLHPPMDFRMHCVLRWMYGDKMREATESTVTYVQGVFTEVMRQAGAQVPKAGARV
jgi:hypothetical protein